MQKARLPKGYSFIASIFRTIKQVKDPIGSMEESMLVFGGTYTVHLGMKQFVSTQDPELIEHVLKSSHRNFEKSEFQTKQLGRFLGKGLLTSNGEFWLRQRRLIQPGFHYEKINALYAIMKSTVDRFIENFPEGKLDTYPLMNRLAFNMVIDTLFNVQLEDERRNDLSAFVYETQDFVIKDIRQPYKSWWYKLSGEENLNFEKAKRARAIIREIIITRKHSNVRHNDLLDMLLEARYEDSGQPMEEDQLIDEILVLLIAGHETTANALAWALYLLAKHPVELNQIRLASLGLSLAETVKCAELNAVVRETMRLYPPAWITDRVAVADDTFKNYVFPAGTVIIMFLFGLHRDKKYWDAPDEFRPARFLKGGEGEKTKSYVPFGAGPRLCIGNNFAMAEMTIFLQSFIQTFDFAFLGMEPRPVALVTLKPDKVLLNFSRRRQ